MENENEIANLLKTELNRQEKERFWKGLISLITQGGINSSNVLDSIWYWRFLNLNPK